MKKLSPTEIANFAVQRQPYRNRSLRRYKAGWAPFSYRPAKSVIPEIVNVQAFGFLGERTPIEKVSELVKTKCRKGKNRELEIDNNLQIVSELFEFCENHNCSGVSEKFGTFLFDTFGGVSYWYDAVIMIDGEPFVLFFDTRKSHNLSKDGQKFVFSVMNEQIRVRLAEEFGDVNLGILHFDSDENGDRITKLIRQENELYSFEELAEMLSNLYADWQIVWNERRDASQREADDWEENDNDDKQQSLFG